MSVFNNPWWCLNCRKYVSIRMEEIIDTERDDVWEEPVCSICNGFVIDERPFSIGTIHITDEEFWNLF